MSDWDVPQQRASVDVLRSAVARGEVAHAWAFLGPSGVGQEELARWLAAALLCVDERRSAGAPCGRCGICDRCRRGTHPGCLEFAPTGLQHRVADVRERWLTTASRTASEGSWRVLRIVRADRMNEAAANAFLKGLEEPATGTVWVLDVSDPDELPDTILSRCRAVRLAPWSTVALGERSAELGLATAEDQALAARAAGGSPAALARLTTPTGLDDLRRHRGIIRGLLNGSPGFPLVAAAEIEEELKRRLATVKEESRQERAVTTEQHGDVLPPEVVRQLDERDARRDREVKITGAQGVLDDMAGYLRDCLAVAALAPADALIDPRGLDELQADAARLDSSRALSAIDRIFATRDDLERNLQQRLTFEALLLELFALVRR